DYFKAEAIPFAWNLVTKEYGIGQERLWITIYQDDEEAFEIWNRKMGIPGERIFRLGEKENFWAMGDTGPCGPCSEIHYDQGAAASELGHEDCAFPCDCGRYVEIWNLVFMQFDRDASGKLTPLPKPSIDTGMGLERITAVLQGKTSNFETDLLKPLILQAAEIAQRDYGQDSAGDVSLRVIADHSRAAAFLISDGVIPSNEGRGYVLRKIVRRGIRNGKLIGIEDPFLYKMTGYVVELMKEPYPELVSTREYVSKVVKSEEQRFSSTIRIAIDQLSEILGDLQKLPESKRILPGDVIFKFYDTFGLPIDLIQEVADETQVRLDEAGFTEKLEAQSQRGRANSVPTVDKWQAQLDQPSHTRRSMSGLEGPQTTEPILPLKTEFVGYTDLQVEDAKIVGIRLDGREANFLAVGQSGDIFLDKTPFYAETGGQVGDTGVLEGDNSEAIVHNTTPLAPGYTAHSVKCIRGTFRTGDLVKARVDVDRRLTIMKNHTATHLLHAALRKLVGFHVKQAGSLVAPDRLRFDFTHYAALSPEEVSEIENMVNAVVMENSPVTTAIKDLDSAVAEGAMALFGEKYGDKVRVVSVNNFSKELCGGTHVSRTGDIGLFKIVSESGIAAGVRRIEAVTGPNLLSKFREDEQLISQLEEISRGKRTDLPVLFEKYQTHLKAMEKELDDLKYRLAKSSIDKLLQSALTIKDVKVL